MNQKQIRLLVVDDTQIWREMLTDALTDEGYLVEQAASSEQAMQRLNESIEKIDFVLMDQVLLGSKLDGIAATKVIRTDFPETRVIVMTVYGDGESSQAALDAGAYRYVFRSMHLDEAVTEITNIIQSAHDLAKLEKGLAESYWTKHICPADAFALGVVDRTYRILYANASQDKLAGRKTQHGGICWIEWHQAALQKGPCSWCPVKPIFEGRQSVERVVPLVKQGKLQYWLSSASPIYGDDGSVIAALKWGLNITAREEAHRAALKAADIEERLAATVDQITMLGYSRARLYEYGSARYLGDRDMMFGRKASGGSQIQNIRWECDEDPYSQKTLRSQVPLIFRKEENLTLPVEPALKDPEVHEWLEIPLRSIDGQIIGKISVDNKDDPKKARPDKEHPRRLLSADHFESFLALAEFAANAIRDARKFEQTRKDLELQRQLRELDADISRELSLQPLFNSIIKRAVELLSADGGSLLLCDYSAKKLRVQVALGLHELIGKSFDFGEGIAGKIVFEKIPIVIDDYFAWPYHSQKLDEGTYGKQFKSMLGVPILDPDKKVIGVLNLSSSDPRKVFTMNDAEILESFADRAAIAIKTAALFEEKNALLEMSKAIAADLHPDEISKKIFEAARQLIPYEQGLLLSWNAETNELVVRYQVGYDPDFLIQEGFTFKCSEGYTGWIADTRKPLLISDTHDRQDLRPKYFFMSPFKELRSYAGVPLILKDQLLGAIALTSSVPGILTEEHLHLLEALAGQIAVVYEQARLFDETEKKASENEKLALSLQRRARQLAAINRIAVAMRGEDVPETVLRIALTGATAGEVLGFSRALYFSCNEAEQMLEGVCAIGAMSRKEAERNWRQAAGMQLDDYIKRARDWSGEPRGTLDAFVRNLRIPLNEQGGLLAKAVMERKILSTLENIQPVDIPSDLKPLRLGIYAVVPLIAKEKVIGIILIDHKFLSHEIKPDDVAMMENLAAITAIAYENAKLIKDQKESFGEIAHQLQSPVTTIRGYARLLLDGRPRDAITIQEYYHFIAEAIEYLHGLANNLLDLRKIDTGTFTLVKSVCLVQEIVNSATDFYKFAAQAKEIDIRIFFNHSLDYSSLYVDKLKIITVLQNLVENAIKYSESASVVTITTRDSERSICIEVRDHGIGIPDDEKHKIFDRHFRGAIARENAIDGTGVGLTIACFIVKQHMGKILLDSTVGQGSAFTVVLPLGDEILNGKEKEYAQNTGCGG